MPDVDEVKFLESARASLALAQLAAKNNLQVMTLNDVDLALQRAIGLRPGFYPEWFFENRCPLLPEGEVAASIAAYMLQKVSDQHVNYMEPHCIDAEHDCFVAQHLGPNDYTDPVWAKRVQIATNTLNAKAACKYPGAAFGKYRFSPGLKTALHVSECRGTFKMVFTLLDSLDGDHFMEGYSHGIMRPHLPMDSFFEQLMEIGITQHFLIADGDWRPELRFLGKITGMEVHSIE